MVRVASPVFVGRAAELAALDHALETAAAGRATTVLIGGDAGVGKSRLLAAWNDRAREQGATVILGSCLDAGEGGPAYAAIVQALRGLFASIGSAGVEAFVGPDRGALSRILPELGATAADGDSGAQSTSVAQMLLFQRLVDIIDRAATDDGPLVLELEDLHWADPSTRAFLPFLLLSLPTARMLLLGTYRSDETVRDHPLARTLRQLDRTTGVSLIGLAPFDVIEARELLTAILGSPPSKASVEAIFDRSEGNALFAEELLATGDPGRDLPNSVGEALLARTATLSSGARSVLRLASVAGRTTPYLTLQRAAALDHDRLADALREAVAANIVETDQAGERFRFRHALLQEAVYSDVMPGERRLLHASVAAALEANAPDALLDPDLVPQLAHHWYQAGDPDRALPAAVAAGDLASRQGAHAAALHHYERVIELWEQAPLRRAGRSRAALLQRAARSAYFAGEPRKTTEYGEQALDEIDEATDRILLVAVLDDLRLAWDHLGTGNAVVRYANRLASVDPVGLPILERATILEGRIMALERQGDVAAAMTDALELQRLADLDDHPGLRARGHLALGWLLLESTEFDGARREARLAADLASVAGDTAAHVQAHNLLYEAAWTAGRYEETIEAVRAFRPLADRAGLLAWEGSWASLAEADALHALGRLDESLQVLHAQLRDPSGDRSRWLLRIAAAAVEIDRGELSRAAEHLDVATWEATPDDEETLIGHVPLTQARLAAADGRFDDVRTIVLENGPRLAALAPRHEADLVWPMIETGLGAEASRSEAARAAGDADALADAQAAARTMAFLVDDIRGSRQETWVSDTSHHRGDEALIGGHLARIEGRDDDPARWIAAAAEFPSGSIGWLVAQDRRAEAMLAAGAGVDELADVVVPAYVRAVEIGARPLAGRLESIARRRRIRLQVPAREGPAAHPSTVVEDESAGDPGHEALRRRGLSEREIEVLTLVAAGYSNAQIADRLFISPKTASVHVSHILDKLGASSRTEAATIGVRLGLPEVEPPET